MPDFDTARVTVIRESDETAVVNKGFVWAWDYDGSGNMIYAGKAQLGTAKTEAKWQIRKFLYSGTNASDEQWAGGSPAFDKVWNSRATYSYS